MARDRSLFPFAASGGEHLSELGDGRCVGAFRPLTEQVCLGFGQRRGRRGGEGKGAGKRRLDREHRFSPMSKPSRLWTRPERFSSNVCYWRARRASVVDNEIKRLIRCVKH